jgi:putative cell wall-binding protein/peptidoglycan/xylan/chitin deacetylase (PgdA/CDA1 family)
MRRRIGRLVATTVAAVGLAMAPLTVGTAAVGTTALPAQEEVQAPTIQDGDLDFSVQRLAGADRYAVAARISRQFSPAGTPVAYVANGWAFADALSAGPAAGLTGGPVLFVRADGIPAVTATELTRLRPGRIVVVGGPTSVSASVLTALDSYTAGSVTRVGGADRFVVSAGVSAAVFPGGSDIAYVATGRNWPDALSAGAAAVVQGAPVLLTDTNRLPSEIRAELQRLDPSRIMLVGGPSSVTDVVAAELRTIATTERVWDDDRYSTAIAVSQRVFGPDRPGVVIASGLVFADALAGVPAASTTRGPILLARTSSLPYSGELDRITPTTAYVLGGTATLTIEVPKAAQRERGVCWAGPDYTGGTPQVLTTVSGTTTKKMAFTLDMGGRLDGASQIVDYLIDNQVCTTFFPSSIMADTTEGRAIVAKISAHPELFEIGNHTVHHCDLVLGGGGSPSAAPCQVPMTASFIRAELTGAESSLLRQTGLSTKPYWRPPYGSHNTFVREQATAVGYPITVMWARDTIDWDPDTTTAQIVARTTSPLPPSGAIVLAHLGGYRTPAALPQIVSTLRANGYTMTTVSDMRDG